MAGFISLAAFAGVGKSFLTGRNLSRGVSLRLAWTCRRIFYELSRKVHRGSEVKFIAAYIDIVRPLTCGLNLICMFLKALLTDMHLILLDYRGMKCSLYDLASD